MADEENLNNKDNQLPIDDEALREIIKSAESENADKIPDFLKPKDGKSLEDMLQSYHAAMEAEFNLRNLGDSADDAEKMSEKVRKELLTLVGTALAGMGELAAGASSESVKFNACKFIIAATVGGGKIGEGESEMDKLFNRLTVSNKEKAESERD